MKHPWLVPIKVALLVGKEPRMSRRTFSIWHLISRQRTLLVHSVCIAVAMVGSACAQDGGLKTAAMPPDELRLRVVRQQLEEQYKREEAANKDKDVAAMLALRVSDCSGNGPGGIHSSCQDMGDYTRQLMTEIGTVASLTNTILALKVAGDTAVATVAQHFVRTQTKMGKLRNIDTSAIQDETWVQTPQGWKLKLVANVHARRWYVDGKRIDPHKPYNPDAPPYNPPITTDE